MAQDIGLVNPFCQDMKKEPLFLAAAALPKGKEADFSTLLCLDRQNFAAIVGTASLARSVGQTGSAALGASDDTGNRELPVGVTSLIASSLGHFTLGNSHVVTPP